MATLLIVAGIIYLATIVLVVLPLCFGVIVNVWREALRRDRD